MADFDDLEKPILGTPRMAPGQKTKYVPNHSSFGAFIRSDQVRDPTVEVAKDIAAMAATVPDALGSNEPSKLAAQVRKGFKVKKNAGLLKVAGNLRVKVEVYNNVDGSALFEHGARNIRRHRWLGKAGAAFGDFKPEGGPS